MIQSELQGKIAIVTGAAAGIGKALTEAFVVQGIRVAAMDIDQAGVMALQDAHGKDAVLALKVDVSDPASCEAAVAATVSQFGGLDILVNNAALGMNAVHPRYQARNMQIEDVSEETWQRFMMVNICGPFFMSRQVVPVLRTRKWGRIINVGTSFFTMLRPGFSPYGPSKAAVEAYSLMLSRELEGSGITVNVVLPGGPANTQMVPDEEGLDRATLIPVEIMAPPMLALFTKAGDGITGQRILAIDWDPALADPAAQKMRSAAWPELAIPLAALPKKN
ncbi:SDR family oxidoreductase [Bosea sp. 124]|uniref:SDR family NAD(P)-dependent oxidoreductase n=1 Tax=Bosea sp. 124 TaxID=2135642 RepID=UPI000D442DB6|nr:SDR family oxidoreductase [Bosea sp. 124]PTM40625.1 3-oxoacyl-[acyl-carrier protein] reductase [Bosea sp. 124]